MSGKPKKHRNIYFQPNQLIFLVKRDVGVAPAAGALIDWANRIITESKVSKSISDIRLSPSKDVFNFDPVQNRDLKRQSSISESESNLPEGYRSPAVKDITPFSLVFADAKSKNWPPFSTDEDPKHQEAQEKALNELLDLAFLLDSERHQGVPAEVEVVSLNWLLGAGPEPGGTGGPGGRPTPFRGPTNTDKYKIQPSPKFLEKFKMSNGEKVTVAILDTAYEEDELKNLKPQGSHDLYEALLGNNKRLTVHPDETVKDYLPGVTIDGHDYDMTDHGLFVAGIINSLAPQAELHLYQVLNKYGLGDLRSIARALKDVYDRFSNKKLVVNLSLTINIPLERGHIKSDDDVIGNKLVAVAQIKKDDNLVDNSAKKLKDWYDRQSLFAEQICDLAYALGFRVIAAAGNNRDEKQQPGRPHACYPAALESVLGVGALPKSDPPQDNTKKLKTTSYSNKSDRPQETGITTLGGEEGDEQGVLGIYLGNFPPETNPDQDSNTNGWGWWAGTSFATPIISGLTAAVLSAMPDGSTTEAAIAKLFEAQEWKTEDDEDVLYVTQGSNVASPPSP